MEKGRTLSYDKTWLTLLYFWWKWTRRVSTLKHWLCYSHVKCIGSVSRMIQLYDCLDFQGNCLWCFWFDALLYTHQPFWMIECWKTSICQHLNVLPVTHSTSYFRVLKNQISSKKIYNPLDWMSALEAYLHLHIGNSCIVWRLLWNFFLWSIFLFCIRPIRMKYGITTI